MIPNSEKEFLSCVVVNIAEKSIVILAVTLLLRVLGPPKITIAFYNVKYVDYLSIEDASNMMSMLIEIYTRWRVFISILK